jgi:hypothetical protein
MAETIIKIIYDDGSSETWNNRFDSLSDAKVYSRRLRMWKAKKDLEQLNKPLHRGSKLYQAVVNSGKIKQGEIITKKRAEELLSELQLF